MTLHDSTPVLLKPSEGTWTLEKSIRIILMLRDISIIVGTYTYRSPLTVHFINTPTDLAINCLHVSHR